MPNTTSADLDALRRAVEHPSDLLAVAFIVQPTEPEADTRRESDLVDWEQGK